MMQRHAVTLLLLVLGNSWSAAAQDLQPAYSRGGFDYYSAPVEPAGTRAVPTWCEKRYGKHTELQQEGKGYRCIVTTPSEPRLSTRLNEEIALADQFPEPRRQKVVDALIDKYQRLAQCPAGTEPFHDGSMYSCARTFGAKELCPSGSPAVLESGEIGCVVSSCPRGATDLGPLTRNEHAGCFKCPRGSYDTKETEAFHGALKGMPSAFTDVFCKAISGTTPKDSKGAAPPAEAPPAEEPGRQP